MAVDIVREIKDRTDLVELISGYVPLRRAGRAHKGLCPFHSEKTPSFTVDGERGFFKCYGCGKGGDCFTFVQEREGLSFNEAGELLARRLGLEWSRKGDTAEKRSERERLYDMNALAERFFRQSLERFPAVRQYLERRGLRPETIEEFRLGYAPPGYEALLGWLKEQRVPVEEALKADLVLQGDQGRLRDRFVDRVIFPICDLEGRVIAFGGRTMQPDGIPKYLNTRETPIFQKGRTLYGLHLARTAIKDTGFTVAVEGYMDLIALHQAGIRNVVASMGTAITQTNIEVLRRFSSQGHMVLCYDGDSAGLKAALRNASEFEAVGCEVRVAVLPEGHDPDTYLQAHGADAFRSLLNRAEPLLDYQLSLLRARYNLRDPGTRLPFVREAARIIAQSSSHLTRQEYGGRLARSLERLAEEWYPGDPHQARQAYMALTQEINRLLRTDRREGPAGRTPPAAVPAPSAPVSAQVRAERYVLRAALSEERWAEQVAQRVTAEHFTDTALAGIARSLLGDNGDGETLSPAERAEKIRSDTASAVLVSELLIQEEPLDEEAVSECLTAVERNGKQRRKQFLLQAQAEGLLAPDDPRGEELRQLILELGGRQRRED